MAENSSSQPQQGELPDSKRQKMSTTATSDDEDNHENAETIPRKPKYRRRKIAIFFAYCGVGYQGMQKNPGAKTIEGDLEEALYLSGAVPEPDRGHPRRYDWARSARTDKGVSAVGQVVSGRFYVDPPGFVERLNSNLAPQIRVFGYKRTTPSFSSKKFCDRRRYVYLVPVFALDPSCHRDRESVMASLGSGNELVKCLECSERGRKVFGVMGKRSYESKTVGENVEARSGISSNNVSNLAENKVTGNSGSESISCTETGKLGGAQNEKITEKMEDDTAVLIENNISVTSSEKDSDGADNDKATSEDGAKNVDEMKEDRLECEKKANAATSLMNNDSENKSGVGTGEIGAAQNEKMEDNKAISVKNNVVVNSPSKEDNAENAEKMKVDGLECENANDPVKLKKKSEFHYGEKEKERFNRILKHYEGTHNFHNFTTRTKAEDPAAKRYILSFNANTVINIDGIDFVKCEVVGQSFMLHQIRKMIGLAVAIMRNCAPESLIETAFHQKVNLNVPMAPEVGLYLDECFFSSYNQKWGDSHEELSMKDYADEAEEFKLKYIYSHIASTENKDGSMALWLHSLNYRNYPDLRFAENATSSENCEVAAANHDEIKNMDE